MLSNDELLHINGEAPEGYDAREAELRLNDPELGEVYRYQLVMAVYLEQRILFFEEHGGTSAKLGTHEFIRGQIAVLRELWGHLRLGEFLPGGWCFDEVVPELH